MASSKLKDYKFECVYCDPKLEMYFSTTKEAMIRHCRIAHDVEEQRDAISNINQLPVVNLAQIFEKLPGQERLKIEQVCKNWQHVAKNFSWANYRIFNNYKYKDWPDTRAMQIQPFFERCGRHLRHLTLWKWSPQTVLTFIRVAPNVVHLKFWQVKLDNKSLKELAGIVPGLKSLAFEFALRRESKGLIKYLYIYGSGALFDRCSFVQFPSNLKYLDLSYVSNAAQILSWVAKGCKNLKGLYLELGCNIDENLFHAISRIKSLTYLAMDTSRDWKPTYEIGYVFEELTELRALQIDTLDEKMISAIMKHCNKLEHLAISDHSEGISPEQQAAILRLTSLPNLCSFAISADNYSREQRTELRNRLIAKGNFQYIKMDSQDPLEPEVLLEILRRCKSIRSIGLDFGPMNSDFYSKICQAVDEIDEEERKQGEFTGITHPIVEVQYNKKMAGNITTPYKWLRFKDHDDVSSAICEKWKFGWLGAGKPVRNIFGNTKGQTSGGNIDVNHCGGENTDVTLSTSGGNVNVANCTGRIMLRTSGGDMGLNNLTGTINARTSGGNIRASALTGNITVRTSGGNLNLNDISGGLSATTSGGNIDATMTKVTDGTRLKTSGGSVDFSFPSGHYNLTITGDNVDVSGLNNFNGTKTQKSVKGQLNGGGTAIVVTADTVSVKIKDEESKEEEINIEY